jgi:multisubunit Na+/H+ antiporter MnhF subunit
MTIFAISVLIFIILLLTIGLFRSCSTFERILFINSITNICVIMIAILSSFESKESYLDIAIIYAVLSFLAIKGFLNYYKIEKKD